MTQDQIIAVLHKVVAENQNFTTWTVSTPHLVALVTHAIEAEREACAKVCDDNATDLSEGDWDSACTNCAYHIRARGEA